MDYSDGTEFYNFSKEGLKQFKRNWIKMGAINKK
jgi:hypothetical protein